MSQFYTSGTSGSSSELVHLATRTASSSSLIEFTSLITNAYRYYQIIISNLTLNTGGGGATNSLYSRVSDDNGATYETTGYNGMTCIHNSGNALYNENATDKFPILLAVDEINLANVNIIFNNFATATKCSFSGTGFHVNSGYNMDTMGGDGPVNVNAISFYSTVNILTGTFDLYGIV